MTNLETNYKIDEDFNKNIGSIIYDKENKVVATLYHLKTSEKKELIKRINDFPKLIKLAIKVIDENKEEDFKALHDFLHNYSRKNLELYK